MALIINDDGYTLNKRPAQNRPVRAQRQNSVIRQQTVNVGPSGARSLPAYNPAPAAPSGPSPEQVAAQQAAAAQARANAEGRSRATAANDATRRLVEGQKKLLDSFGTARDTKLGNITRALQEADKSFLANYGLTLGGLMDTVRDNEKSEADASFSNVTNAIRERGDILAEVASQGAGESDMLRAQLQALRNYDANQNEINRSFFDTLRANNRAITGLNTDVSTSRSNLYNQAESDRESAWANFYNQTADTWTQIQNIENSNTNVDSDSSVAYQRVFGNAADEAAKAAGSNYKRAALPTNINSWSGRGEAQERELTSSNRAATVSLGAPLKRPEGATLRKW